MHPILFQFGPVTIFSYGALVAVGFLLAVTLAARTADRWPASLRAMNAKQVADVSWIALLGGILGARLLYIVLNWKIYWHAPGELIAIWHGGLIWYGGFLGGFAAAFLYLRAQRVPFLRAFDQFVPFLALGHAIGRIGCLLNGCCYGKPVDGCCGITPHWSAQPLVPTQLYEALGLLALYAGLRWLQRPNVLQRAGAVAGLYLISYGILRFTVEAFRGDQTFWWHNLTLPQLMSAGVAAAGLVLIAASRWRGHTSSS